MSTPTKNLFPPGHFYSPIPAIADLERDRARIFDSRPRHLPGIDLDDAGQLALIRTFSESFYDSMPFQESPHDGLRYGFTNPAYGHTDAIFLHCMIRHARPKRIIEVGSGYSSCVTLDTNDGFFGGSIDCTFIEPYPALLNSLLKPEDPERIVVIGTRVQDVDLSTFDALEANDILFIDSTHVSKTGSDVNYLFFEVLPRLKPGVLIHVHDIFYPFEYPEVWALQGRAWNEAYLLRAFLQFNQRFQIVLFANYLVNFHLDELLKLLPKCAGNLGGNIWIRRV